jgi:hypothetical protein
MAITVVIQCQIHSNTSNENDTCSSYRYEELRDIVYLRLAVRHFFCRVQARGQLNLEA